MFTLFPGIILDVRVVTSLNTQGGSLLDRKQHIVCRVFPFSHIIRKMGSSARGFPQGLRGLGRMLTLRATGRALSQFKRRVVLLSRFC